jgi:subtilase family serine protease
MRAIFRSFSRLSLSDLLYIAVIAITACSLANTAGAQAVSTVAPLVTGLIDESQRVELSGNIHPAAQARFDQGRVEDSFPAERIHLLLKRSPAQEQALQSFLRDAHTPGTASYQQWLTPAQFGRQFGAADSDIAAATAWLQSHGFSVNKVHPGRTAIEFSGTAGQIRDTFQTEIHRYVIKGETQYAASGNPSIPAALAGLIGGISPMNSFHGKPLVQVSGKTSYNLKTHQATPEWSYPLGGGYLYLELAPADFEVQYDLKSVYAAGTKGTGVSIGILSASNIDLSVVQAYRKTFDLPATVPTVVIDGYDPGENGAAEEAYLDVEQSGAVAPEATVMLYTSAGTVLSDPLLTSGLRALDDNLVSVMSMSYGTCEAALGASGNEAWLNLWEQAAAQGITGFVSAGDGGSAGCDDFDTEAFASAGLAVNGFGSTPYNVSVGGTDFYYSDYAVGGSALNSQLEEYWSFTTSDKPAVSLLKTVPEQVWNGAFGYNATNGGVYSSDNSNIIAGSGGSSSAAVYPAKGTPTGYPKPAWQAGKGVPADKVRDLPDVSLYASNGFNYTYYPICALPGDCVNPTSAGAIQIESVGGTSASSPSMAAIQALVDQATKARQGQANYVYYALANKSTTANSFHDIVVGGNEVPCTDGSPNCVLGTSGQTDGNYAESGYLSTSGYDRASGLGSVDVAKLISNWSTVTFKPTTTTLSISPVSFVHGTAATVKADVTPKTGSGTPTGSIGLMGNDSSTYVHALDAFTLTNGAGTYSADNLPGGTYQVTADYSGDSTFAGSTSAPITVTVTPEKDTLTANGYYYNPTNGNLYSLSAGASIPYGSELYLDLQPVGVNEAKSKLGENSPATGSIAITDKSATTVNATLALDSYGTAEWAPSVVAVGSHTVSASYAGDNSYDSSTLSPASTFKVVKGPTTLYVNPYETTIEEGSTLTVVIQLYAGEVSIIGALPSGNVTVTLGSQKITTPLKYWYTANNGFPVEDAVVTFTKVPAGTPTLSATYAGDANWTGTTQSYGTITSTSTSPAPAVTLTASTKAYTPSQTVTMTGTVTGISGKGAPSGYLYFYWDDGGAYYYYTMQQQTSDSSSYTLTFPANELAPGNNIFTAVFYGDSNYSAQASLPMNITLAGSDFGMNATTQNVPVKIGSTGTGTILLTPIDGYDATVALTCAAPTGITCTLATASPTVGASGVSDTVTFKVASTVKTGSYPAIITATGGGRVHNLEVIVSAH